MTDVFPDSPAAAADIHKMDVITQYGEYPIVDDAGFFAARNHYEQAFPSTVEIVVWRGVFRMTAKVRTGKLGVSTVENDKVSQEFRRMMGRINAMRQIPAYQHDREFKGQFTEGTEGVLKRAKALIDQAEREGTLTPTQILLARIYMILDDAPADEQKRQAELLQELFATQPTNFIHMLGNDKFFKHQRYRPATACLNHYLKSSPDDVSMRLNMAVAYNRLGMYDEAEVAVNYVYEHRLGLSDYGHFVAYHAKAFAALGRKDYARAIELAEKALELNQDEFTLIVLQLAAAQMGEAGKLEAAIRKYQEVLPAKYDGKRIHFDALTAYVMVKNNQRETARQIVSMWKDIDMADERVNAYWQKLPNGVDVATNWSELMRN